MITDPNQASNLGLLVLKGALTNEVRTGTPCKGRPASVIVRGMLGLKTGTKKDVLDAYNSFLVRRGVLKPNRC